MSRLALNIVVILAFLAFAGCGPHDSSARAESVSPAAAPKPSGPTVPAEVPTTGPQPTAPAPSGERASNALDQLKAQLNEIAAERIDSTPVQVTVPTTTVPGDTDERATEDVETLRAEVHELRRNVARLQETVDAALAYLVGELGDENRRLKKDIATPEQLEQDAAALSEAPHPDALTVPAPAPTVDYGKSGYLVIKEWGRTPDQARDLGGDVTSLRGLICAVRPGAADDELKAIGKKLRDQCAGYDNINIEVFDDEAAAHDYAERNVKSTVHYVMRITRHKASAQDVSVLVRDGGAREIVVE